MHKEAGTRDVSFGDVFFPAYPAHAVGTHMTRVPGQKILGQCAPMLQPVLLPAQHIQPCGTGAATSKLGGKLPRWCRAPAQSGGRSCRAPSSPCSQARGCWRSSAATGTISSFQRGTNQGLFSNLRNFLNRFPTPASWECPVRKPDFPVLPALQNDRRTQRSPDVLPAH